MKRLPLLPTSDKFRRVRLILSGLLPGSALNSAEGIQRLARADSEKRRGAVLIVVLMLMILLLFLGITWFTFASTEHTSATYFAESAKTPYGDVTLDADMVFDFALEQLILGTNRPQSAIYPGINTSLLGTMLGHFNAAGQPLDRHPFNGRGVNLISTAGGAPQVDQNYDGIADADQTLLKINFSSCVTGTALTPVQIAALPSYDVDYTYPDQNNPWLAYVAVVNGKQVVIPSFHRPALLRDGTGAQIGNWYNNVATADRVFRPHPSHLIVGTSTPRFLSAISPGPDGQPGKAGIDDDGANGVDDPGELGAAGSDDVKPFPFAQDVNVNTISGEQGVWTNPANPTNLDYDVDPTGNGYRAGVWLDIDFPRQTLPDGRMYVPLISYHVIDGDALINSNVAGNVPPMMDKNYPGTSDPQFRMSYTQPIGSGQSLHSSNLGLDPTEINPTWAFTADPTNIPTHFASTATANAALQQYRGFYGSNPATAIELANMELLNMLLGRPQYSVTGTIPTEVFTLNELQEGRWGEVNALLNGVTSTSPRNPALFPRPGSRATSTATQAANSPTDTGDDNGDRYHGVAMDDGNNWLAPDLLLPGIILPGFVHPIDWTGRGSYTQSGTYGPIAVLAGDPGDATNPSTWLKYQRYQGRVFLDNAFGGGLNQTTTRYGNVDHPNEVIVDQQHKQPTDRTFGYEEMAGIHLSQTDFSRTGASSRHRQLLSANFDSNLLAGDIRQKFTVASWDRRQHNFGYNVRRPWEYNADVNGNGNLEFPPVFLTANGNSTFVNSLGQTLSKEPFRAEVVAQMGVELDDTGMSTLQRQLKLNLNRLCIIDDNAYYRRDQLTSAMLPRFRNLTPHPALDQTGDNTIISTTASWPPTTAAHQEFWARLDRQRLARDIYVLLYTLGGGQDGLAYDATNGANYADITGAGLANNTPRTPTTGPLYNDTQLQVMAQFAVNYVDALDRDNVITKFEYDKNLGDGWNLGDNPYTTADDDSSMPAADRGVVYGVEAQLLTFSEVLAFISKKDAAGTTDFPCTTFDDKTQDHPYMFVELRNVSPYNQTWSNSSWRIRRVPSAAVAPAIQPFVERRLVITSGSIAAGRQYTVGTQDGTDKFIDPNDGVTTVFRSSDFRVDYDRDNDGILDGLFYRVAPHRAEASPPQAQTVPTPAPGCDLDLVHDRDQAGRFTLTDGSGTTVRRGGFVWDGTNPLEPAPGLGDTFTLVLERRVHLTRTSPSAGSSTQEADNPWVEVDRIDQNSGLSEFTPDSTPANIRTSLPNLRSTERAQPFDRTGEARHAADTTGFQSNSIGQDTLIGGLLANSNTAGAFTRWQPHFDRDFVSVIELLSLPLYGPDQVTSKLSPDGANAAAALFLRPQDPTNDGAGSPTLSKNNRWYRLLDAVEVPPRMHQQLEQQQQAQLNASGFVSLPRTPGRLNLNTMRHLEVLGALIDDGMITRPSLGDSTEAGRNWWDQFLQARDRRDPTTGLVLPGSPVSRPFRNLTFTDDGIASLESTLLRRLMLDNEDVNRNTLLDPGEDANNDSTLNNTVTPTTSEPRRLFEARTNGDIANNTVDFYTRNRLLSKISGNTTTRSNVFMVWITVGFFQAVETTPGQVQIGAELSGASRYRGFFVVDRSNLEGAFNPQSRKFDFRKFVLHRQTLQ